MHSITTANAGSTGTPATPTARAEAPRRHDRVQCRRSRGRVLNHGRSLRRDGHPTGRGDIGRPIPRPGALPVSPTLIALPRWARWRCRLGYRTERTVGNSTLRHAGDRVLISEEEGTCRQSREQAPDARQTRHEPLAKSRCLLYARSARLHGERQVRRQTLSGPSPITPAQEHRPSVTFGDLR